MEQHKELFIGMGITIAALTAWGLATVHSERYNQMYEVCQSKTKGTLIEHSIDCKCYARCMDKMPPVLKYDLEGLMDYTEACLRMCVK